MRRGRERERQRPGSGRGASAAGRGPVSPAAPAVEAPSPAQPAAGAPAATAAPPPSVPDQPQAAPAPPAAQASPAPAAADIGPQLVVGVGSVLYALPIGGIEEILSMRDITPLPRSAPAVRGVLFLRGHPVTVVDLGLLLTGAPIRGTRIVVVMLDGERYGLVVDQVLQVVSPAAFSHPTTPPAALGAAAAVRAVARLGEEVVSLLDLENLIPAPAAARTGA